MATECFHGIYNQQEHRETFEALWHKSVFQPAWVDMQHHVSVSWATYRLYFPYTELNISDLMYSVGCWPTTSQTQGVLLERPQMKKCFVPCRHCMMKSCYCCYQHQSWGGATNTRQACERHWWIPQWRPLLSEVLITSELLWVHRKKLQCNSEVYHSGSYLTLRALSQALGFSHDC